MSHPRGAPRSHGFVGALRFSRTEGPGNTLVDGAPENKQ
jgi:hypothetical protein